MGRESQIDKLTAEWRGAITKRLDGQDQCLDAIRKDLVEIKLNTSSTLAMQQVEARVRKLEDFQLHALTIMAAVQGGIAILWAVLSKVIFK